MQHSRTCVPNIPNPLYAPATHEYKTTSPAMIGLNRRLIALPASVCTGDGGCLYTQARHDR